MRKEQVFFLLFRFCYMQVSSCASWCYYEFLNLYGLLLVEWTFVYFPLLPTFNLHFASVVGFCFVLFFKWIDLYKSVLCHFIGSGNLDKLVFDQRLKLLGKTRVCWMSFLPLCLSVPPHDGLLHRGLFPVQLSKWRAAGSILSEGGEGSAGIYTLFPCPRPASWAADLWNHTGPHHTHRGSMLGLILWSWRFEMLNNNF